MIISRRAQHSAPHRAARTGRQAGVRGRRGVGSTPPESVDRCRRCRAHQRARDPFPDGVLATAAFPINRPAECPAGIGKPLIQGWEACWTDWPNQQGFSSLHIGGAHFALCDGSSRFISQNIGLDVYRNLATIQGGEVIGEF